MKYFAKAGLSMILGCLLSASAFAVVISNPLDYDTAGLVGTADIRNPGANPTMVTGFANTILAMGAGETNDPYRTHNTDDYTGMLDVADAMRVNTSNGAIMAGFDYVMAKYDGQNAGFVLYFLDGQESTIPTTSADIWVNNQDKGYELSNWTGWKTSVVPEPGTVGLLGAGLLALGFIRGKRRV